MNLCRVTAFAFLLGSSSFAALAVPTYRVIDLGVLPERPTSMAWGINNLGQVTGVSGDPFLSTPSGELMSLAMPYGFVEGRAYAVNDLGEAVGFSTFGAGMPLRATYWPNPEGCITLEMPDDAAGNQAFDINNHGQIVGTFVLHGFPVRNRAWIADRSGSYVEIESLPGFPFNSAKGINNDGFVVCNAGDGRNPQDFQSYIWIDGFICVLPRPTGVATSCYAINSYGQVAGGGALRGTQTIMPLVWNWDELYHLGYLPGSTSGVAEALNDRGVVVGNCVVGSGSRATVWYDFAPIAYDLNTLVSNGQGWVLHRALGVNNRGEIAGIGSLNGRIRAYKLVPTDRPPIIIDPELIEQVEGHTIRISHG